MGDVPYRCRRPTDRPAGSTLHDTNTGSGRVVAMVVELSKCLAWRGQIVNLFLPQAQLNPNSDSCPRGEKSTGGPFTYVNMHARLGSGRWLEDLNSAFKELDCYYSAGVIACSE